MERLGLSADRLRIKICNPQMQTIAEVRSSTITRGFQAVLVNYQRIKEMKLKNVLIVVKDIEKSKKFYHDLFGLDVVLDNGGNVILTEGLVLQDRKIWESFLEKEVILRSNSTELYFEEYDLDAFVEKLERLYPRIQYVNKLMTYSWGQKIVRFYDPDGNLIEVRTPA